MFAQTCFIVEFVASLTYFFASPAYVPLALYVAHNTYSSSFNPVELKFVVYGPSDIPLFILSYVSYLNIPSTLVDTNLSVLCDGYAALNW